MVFNPAKWETALQMAEVETPGWRATSKGGIPHSCTSVDRCAVRGSKLVHSRGEILSIFFVVDNPAFFYTPDNDPAKRKPMCEGHPTLPAEASQVLPKRCTHQASASEIFNKFNDVPNPPWSGCVAEGL